MDELTLQWYNTLVAGLNLTSDDFQLYQGSTSIGTMSDWLWTILDAIPPESLNNYYDPSQSNLFTQGYQSVIAQLKSITDTSFQYCMGDYYSIWNSYLKTAIIPNGFYTDKKIMTDFFETWATENAPSQVKCANTLVDSFFNDYVTIANTMYASAVNSKIGLAYNISIEEVNQLLQQSKGASFSSTSTDISMRKKVAWTTKIDTQNIDFFSIGTSLKSRQSSLSQRLTSNTIHVEATFDAITTVEGLPLAEKTSLSSLQKFLPWYNNQAFARAYDTKDNTVWKNGVPSWDTTFGATGNIQRDTYALVIADGINLKITSEANFSKIETDILNEVITEGNWPFYIPNNGVIQKNLAATNTSGNMEITTVSKKGNPQLIGVLVSDIAKMLSRD